jgi:hypothetical protein
MPTLPWTAPKPVSPPDGEITVMASRLELRRLSDVPSFLAGALRIRRQVLAAPGALGLSLIARPLTVPSGPSRPGRTMPRCAPRSAASPTGTS